MNLIVSESEYDDTARAISEAADSLVIIARDYISALQSVKSVGYKSKASAIAIDTRCAKVGKAVEAFEASVEQLSSSTKSYINTIRAIDGSVR